MLISVQKSVKILLKQHQVLDDLIYSMAKGDRAC